MRWLELDKENQPQRQQRRLRKANERESAVAPKVLCVRSNLFWFCWLCRLYHRNFCSSVFSFVISLVFRGCFFVDAGLPVLGELGCDIGP